MFGTFRVSLKVSCTGACWSLHVWVVTLVENLRWYNRSIDHNVLINQCQTCNQLTPSVGVPLSWWFASAFQWSSVEATTVKLVKPAASGRWAVINGFQPWPDEDRMELPSHRVNVQPSVYARAITDVLVTSSLLVLIVYKTDFLNERALVWLGGF